MEAAAAAAAVGDRRQPCVPLSGDGCRQRRRWVVSEGRRGGSEDGSGDDAQSPAVLRLVPFSFPPHVNFGTVPVGTSRVRRLVLENPNAEPAAVTVRCPRPPSKGFTTEQDRCFLQSGERILIPVTWTPLEDGPVREVITFVVNDIIRHQAIVLGVAKQLTKKKKSLWDTIKKRTPARQSRLKKRLPIIKNVNKDFQMSEKTSIDRSPLQSFENVTSNGYSILSNRDPMIMLEKRLSLSPISPNVQENGHVLYTTLSVRRSTVNSALGTESHHELQQDTKETSAIMSPCGDFVETTFGSACLKKVKSSSDKDSVFTPKQLQVPLIHRKILSPDSFVNDSYELIEEPLAMPIVSPNQFLRENQVALQAPSQGYISESVSSRVESCALTTIFSGQKEQLKVVTPYLEVQPTNQPFSGLHDNKKKTSQYEKFEQKGDEAKKSNQIQICSFQKESKKRPVLSNTVIKRKLGHPEEKGPDTMKLKSRKCLSNAIQQSVDTKRTNLEILPELPVIKPISSEGKCNKSTTPSCSRTISCNRKRKTEGRLDYANSRNEEQVENLEPKKVFISCIENEINPSEIPPSISAKKERESQKKRTESLSQKWRTSKTGKKHKKMVPVAQSQLTFVKPLKTGIPRHPMPFVAKNMFYDERWKEKQQRAFTWWLNFVLTPDDFTVKTDTLQVDAASLMLGTESCHKPSVPRAPSKEEVSLRAYTARCKLNKLRRSAYHLFTSHEMVKAIKRLEVEIEAKRLLIRKDRHLWKDIGERQKILNWLLCYNPLWLRIGLEVVYGELIALENNSDVMGLAMFILSRLLWNPDIAAEYRHPTVPHLYREGHEEALSKFTLKKMLLLVCFLDHAKLSRIIDHDPCLFCKNAQFKSSKELLLAFSRDFLSGEGDLSRHLGFLGFQVNHVQMPLDEFDFSVTNLATDLQCGIRLVRALELLSSNWNLSSKLRVPAISKLQKMHNVRVALQVLKDRGIQLEDEHGGVIDAKDIVDRHREKTFALLWKIVFAFQVDVLFDVNQLREEIDFLKNMLVRKEKIAGFGTSANDVRKDSSSFYSSKNCSENVKLLMDWINVVCAFYNVKVENFTVSFSDGRVLCYLIHHYHPCYMPLEAICQRTTLTVECTKHGTLGLNSSSESDASLNLLNETFNQTITASVFYKELLDNEKMNFQMINAAVSNLGGIPAMIHHLDMSNTIPDEKIVITYVSFLCARLLELCKEIRAARLIQSAWRKHRSKTKLIEAVKQKLSATVVIQKHWRRCLAQMKLKKLRKKQQEEAERISSVVIQTCWRRYYARRRYLQLRHYTIIIQARIRMLLAVSAYKKICWAILTIQRSLRALLTAKADQQRYRNLKRSALVIQSGYRRWKTQKMNLKAELQAAKLAKEERAAVVIQSWYRMLRDRKNYLHIRCSVIKIQAWFRSMRAKGIYEQKKQCVITIQRHYRAYRLGKAERGIYLQKRLAVTVLQSAYRGMKARLLNKQVKAAFAIQAHYRAYRKQTSQRQRFLEIKKATLCLQAGYRGYRIRKMLKCQNLAAVKIQTAFRTYAAMRKYQALMQASLVLQRWCRASKTRRKYLRTKAAVTTLQAAFRGWQVRRRIQTQHAAALTIQSAFRRYIALKRFRMVRSAARTLQHHYRSRICGRRERQKYTALRHSVVQLQAVWRGTIVRKQIQRQNQAAVILQSYYRMHACQTKFGSLRTAAVIIQRWYRAVGLANAKRQEYLVLKNAVIKIQAAFRGVRERRKIQQQHQAAVSIQAMFKMHQCYGRYQTMKGAATIIQREYRAFRTGRKEREKYLQQRNAAVVLQAAYRGMSVRQEMRTLHRSAVSIQAFYRMYRQRKHFQKTLAAAKRIQQWYRSCKNRNVQVHKYRQMKSSALRIQSSFRGMKARVCLRKMHMAATIIQRWFRTYLQRQRFVNLKTAAVIIQRKYRATIFAKKAREEYLNLRNAVVIIQCSFRGLLARKRVKEMQAAAVIIQAAFRRNRAYRRYQTIKLASTSIQLYYRSYRKTKHLRETYVKLRRSAVVLQAAYRGMKVRRMLKIQHRAATIIQSHFRKYRQQTSYHKIQRAVKVIQMRYKASKLRKADAPCGEVCIRGILCGPCRRKHQAAILLQRNFRMQRERRKYLSFKSAAVVLQRRFRALILGKRQRQEYVSLYSAVVCMQSYYRGLRVRKLICCLHSAATVIQAKFRMLRAKQSYQKVRGAVITIQKYWRAYLKRRHQRRIYLELQKYVIKVQAIYRGVRIRQKIKAMHISATLIQSFYRMHVQRKQYKVIRWAVITIQSAYRGAASRKIVKKMHTTGEAQSVLCMAMDCRDHVQLRNATKEVQVQDCTDNSIKQFQAYHEAACLIQQRYRSYLTMKYQRLAYLQTLENVIIVQATVRRFIERRRFSRMKRSVIIIQSWYRAKCQRRKYLQYCAKVIKIQRMVRKWMNCRNVASAHGNSMSQQTTHIGITKFQALWRGYLCRKKNDNEEIRAVRNSLVIANTSCREEKKLCNRTTFAIDCLLKYKDFSHILAALKDLETVTRLSSACCESLAQSKAVVTIFTLIRSCNRSIPCMEVIRYSVQILLNLSKYERTTEAVYAVENSVDTLLDLLQMYRGKAGDKISEKGQSIFTKICCLFVLLSKDTRRASEIRSNPQVVARLRNLFRLTARKHEMDAQRMLAKQKSCSFVNGYSSVTVTPAVLRRSSNCKLKKDHMQEITDPLQAIKIVIDKLGIS